MIGLADLAGAISGPEETRRDPAGPACLTGCTAADGLDAAKHKKEGKQAESAQ